MKVYFTCSTADFANNKDAYFKIRDILIRTGLVLTRDWLPHTAKLIETKSKDIPDIKSLYQACTDAIKNADLVIIEDTVSNFSTGHQITLALQHRKPTLVLWRGRKHRHFNQMFIHGIESDILKVSEYSLENVEGIIRTFVKQYGNVHKKNRFHLVLNNVERGYLDWVQFSKNKSRTIAIREALRREMEADPEYSEHLNSSNATVIKNKKKTSRRQVG